MTYPFHLSEQRRSITLSIMVDAIRHRQSACRTGQAGQPHLYARLRRYRCERLSTAFESLIGLCELVLGRELVVGTHGALSADERLLLDLLSGRPRPDLRHVCSEGVARAFCCALLSTRIVMARELAWIDGG